MRLKCEKKILNPTALRSVLLERGQKKLVHCHGCFDFIHPGHIHYFEFAKQLGDLLLVSLNDDAHFPNKGSGRPIFSEKLRAVSIASLEVVDLVCIYPGFIPEKIFLEFKPEVYVKGIEYDFRRGNPEIPEEKMVSIYGGKVVYGPEDMIFSSSKLIQRIMTCQTI